MKFDLRFSKVKTGNLNLNREERPRFIFMIKQQIIYLYIKILIYILYFMKINFRIHDDTS